MLFRSHAIRGSFQTDDPGWRFWRYFVNLGDRVKEVGATVVFESENDLVVNTASMAVLATRPADLLIAPERILDFEGKDKVYHTIYFRQERTVDFLRDSFAMDRMTAVKAPNSPPSLPSKTGNKTRRLRNKS